MKAQHMFFAGSLLAGIAVALGAFGAHWLEGAVRQWDLSEPEQARRLATWEVAVRYQMYHALALLAVGLWSERSGNRWLSRSACCFLCGVAIFSGCLYALVLTGVKILGAVVPIGGSLMIVGWIILAATVWRSPKSPAQA